MVQKISLEGKQKKEQQTFRQMTKYVGKIEGEVKRAINDRVRKLMNSMVI
jgi:hypothetical protein